MRIQVTAQKKIPKLMKSVVFRAFFVVLIIKWWQSHKSLPTEKPRSEVRGCGRKEYCGTALAVCHSKFVALTP